MVIRLRLVCDLYLDTFVPPSIKHLQSIEPQEVRIAFNGTPPFVRMMIQNSQSNLLQRPFICGRGSCVVHDPVRRAFTFALRFADEDHDVKREFRNPRLIEEQQISALGSAAIAAYEDAVEILQRASVGEVCEFTGRNVARLKCTE